MSTIRDSLEELSLLFDETSFSEKKLRKKTKSFLHIFSKLTDTRHQSYIKYSLANSSGSALSWPSWVSSLPSPRSRGWSDCFRTFS